ncbi:unnamed protein product [Acanthoscelides obtectus]|uniref:Uncharacterized protein n=1 Tax=Acanthoscelides obtectus TaxID=200917 RepID=A0A9P0LJ11_ACAOB|nr:unnamed protein product [Acanthoscelides obtectus]CAK1654656.1 hypothetical protein AOBTE_LOCUS18744 [Acanthoscelides obtectus]
MTVPIKQMPCIKGKSEKHDLLIQVLTPHVNKVILYYFIQELLKCALATRRKGHFKGLSKSLDMHDTVGIINTGYQLILENTSKSFITMQVYHVIFQNP